MTQVGTLALPTGTTNLITAADASADGLQLAVRTYAGVLLWTRAAGSSVAATLATPPCAGPTPDRGRRARRSPSSADGRSYTTVSEGTGQTLHVYAPPAG